MEEREDDAGSGRAKDSVLVRAEGPGPEAETGAGSVAAWKTENLTQYTLPFPHPKSNLKLVFSPFRTFS